MLLNYFINCVPGVNHYSLKLNTCREIDSDIYCNIKSFT